MKTCRIILRQGEVGQYEVVRFTNTVQLSVGMVVPVSVVERWCSTPKVQVEIIGLVVDKPQGELPLLLDSVKKVPAATSVS